MTAALVLVAVRVAVFGVLTAVLAEGHARAGAGLLSLVRHRSTTALERWGLAFLLGLMAVSFALLGLALAGLYHPLAICAVPLALLVASRPAWARRSLVADAARELRGVGWWGAAAAAAVAVDLGPRLLSPETGVDSRTYNLGVAWQYMMCGKAVLEHVPFNFHTPLLVETGYGLPLVLADDRLVRCLSAVCCAAGGAAFAGRLLSVSSPAAAWIGPLFALASGSALHYATVCKNDMAAGALFVNGALLHLAGNRTLGTILMGLCIPAKFVYGPAVVAWCLCFPPRPRRLAAWAGCLAVPILPWMIKSWLATGNPVFQFASELFPALHWNETNRALLESAIAANQAEGLPSARRLAVTWPAFLRQEHLPVFLALPGLALLARRRRAALALVVAQLATVAVAPVKGYLLPTTWLGAFLAADAAARLPGVWARIALGGTAVVSAARIALVPPTLVAPWSDAFRPWREVLAERFTTLLEVVEGPALAGPGWSWRPRAPRPPRLLTVGEQGTYRIPARILYHGFACETPLLWRLAQEAEDVSRMSVKFCQLGATRLLLNYVGVEWCGDPHSAFAWDERALAVYAASCRAHLEPAGRSARCDDLNGGYCVLAFRRRLDRPPPERIWFVPGSESVCAAGSNLEGAGRPLELLAAYGAARARLPGVGYVENRVGHALLRAGRFEEAYRTLQPFAASGMMDSLNLAETGDAALRTGRLDEAEAWLEQARAAYPARRTAIELDRALLRIGRARAFLDRGALADAGRALDEAEQLLDGPARASTDEIRLPSLALGLALRAEWHARRGDRDAAAACLRRAAGTAPGHAAAGRWRAEADRLDPGVSPGARPRGIIIR